MCDYKEMAPEVILSKITLQNTPTQIQNPMPAALRSGHANFGRANMGSERGPCTLFWLTLQHMNCAANRSASPWPRIVGAACTVTAVTVTVWHGAEKWRCCVKLPHSHTRAPTSPSNRFYFLASKHSYPTPPSQRAPTQVCSLARVLGPRMWMFNFGKVKLKQQVGIALHENSSISHGGESHKFSLSAPSERKPFFFLLCVDTCCWSQPWRMHISFCKLTMGNDLLVYLSCKFSSAQNPQPASSWQGNKDKIKRQVAPLHQAITGQEKQRVQFQWHSINSRRVQPEVTPPSSVTVRHSAQKASAQHSNVNTAG